MRLFILVTTLALAVYIFRSDGWGMALWFIGVVGFVYWVFSTLIEAMVRLVRWIGKPKPTPPIVIKLYPEDRQPEIIDAEVIEEKDEKWWRV